ncbi:MAG: CPBP family intramembrane metalloprotease [Paludibacteraceae bacterium]|nr:CPBP family intramembrane metalloprotease [Paludibacteraceae bacterium]
MVKRLSAAVGIAFVLWTVMFSPWTAPYIPFWGVMTGSAIVLITLAFVLGSPIKGLHIGFTDLLLGIAVAAGLWGCFWVGDKVSQWLFPSFARLQVDSIYGMKEGISPLLLSALLLFIIGPAEEIFWRGYVQRTLMQLFGAADRINHITRKGILVTLLAIAFYTLVHLFSFNFMLIMAALVCGVVWGGLYYLFPNRFAAVVISHALWDAAVFVWFPIL